MAEKEHEQKKQEKCDHCREIKEIAIDASYIGGKTCHDCLKNICIKADVHTGVCEPFTTPSK